MHHKTIDCPILLIAFNRPDETLVILNEIKKANPPRLYVALDGARAGNESDTKNCKEVRKIIEEFELDGTLKIQQQPHNLGCRDAVVAGIDWFFENEELGIILEDDIVPHEAFFTFLPEMLKKYEAEKDIKAVLGFNVNGQNVKSDDYFFYEGFYPWGWGCWRDRWVNYSKDKFDLNWLKQERSKRSKYRYLLDSLVLNLSLIRKGCLDTWDYQFMYMIFKEGGKTIAPYANMTKNIGVNGAHSTNNELNFEYGKISSDVQFDAQEVNIDERLNALFLREHYDNRRIVRLKKIVLSLGLYPSLRRLFKTLSR
ncbi:hypothetical protein [Shimia sp. MMG029]|uniref:hypothetical protein n=1 Tax=Shimia sp. MMG029 TaxID=3021978 RepID=UPI0022FE5747|nr:hypothetical protein [Shimia sp. MMG029]MDA5556952.1 hypothetical protein [Shimia sp. MMG029]